MSPRRKPSFRYVPSGLEVNAPGLRAVVFAGAIVLAMMAVLGPLRAAPAAAASEGGGTVNILALGDSLTAGYGLPADQAFPVRLEAALKADNLDVRVINAGVSGDTTAGGRARIQWSLGGDPKPDAVILALGANDALRGLDPTEVRANLSAILDVLKARGLPVLLAGMKAPRNLGQEYDREFDAVFPALAKEYDTLYYPFFLEGVATRPGLNQDDSIHPNEKGVARMVRGILPLAKKLVRLARARTRKEAQ